MSAPTLLGLQTGSRLDLERLLVERDEIGQNCAADVAPDRRGEEQIVDQTVPSAHEFTDASEHDALMTDVGVGVGGFFGDVAGLIALESAELVGAAGLRSRECVCERALEGTVLGDSAGGHGEYAEPTRVSRKRERAQEQ